jgi:hypothetical protein
VLQGIGQGRCRGASRGIEEREIETAALLEPDQEITIEKDAAPK